MAEEGANHVTERKGEVLETSRGREEKRRKEKRSEGKRRENSKGRHGSARSSRWDDI